MVSDRRGIAAWVQPEVVLLDVEVRHREHALELVASAIGTAHGLDPGPIRRALERREQAGSTALGGGFAIPHARIAGLTSPLTLFMRAAEGIPFAAPDAKPVRDFLAIMVPQEGDKADHLQLLALISELFSDRTFRVELDGAADAATAAAIFRAGVARIGAAPATRPGAI